MDKKLRDKGLVIIGAERQGSSVADIKKVTDKAKVEFTITKGVIGPTTGRSIPRAVVFDSKGKIIYTGHPNDRACERIIKEALKDVRLSNYSNKSIIAQRIWTNTEGKKITASIKTVVGEVVTFKLYNSKIVKYKLSNLSKADQEMIKLALK